MLFFSQSSLVGKSMQFYCKNIFVHIDELLIKNSTKKLLYISTKFSTFFNMQSKKVMLQIV